MVATTFTFRLAKDFETKSFVDLMIHCAFINYKDSHNFFSFGFAEAGSN